MEEIKINSIDPKFGKPNDKGVCAPFWAVAFNGDKSATVWDEKIAKFMMEEVGVGGTCLAVVKISPNGDFVNIRAVDFNSAKKGLAGTQKPEEADMERRQAEPSRDDKIVAQSLTKCACYGSSGLSAEEVWKAYNYFLEKLK